MNLNLRLQFSVLSTCCILLTPTYAHSGEAEKVEKPAKSQKAEISSKATKVRIPPEPIRVKLTGQAQRVSICRCKKNATSTQH